MACLCVVSTYHVGDDGDDRLCVHVSTYLIDDGYDDDEMRQCSV